MTRCGLRQYRNPSEYWGYFIEFILFIVSIFILFMYVVLCGFAVFVSDSF